MAVAPKKTTKSKTSKAVQQGNENQRENYRATGKPKVSAGKAAKSGGLVNQERLNQRAGGPLNRSYDEKLASKSKLANLASKRNSKDTASRATPAVKVVQQRKAKKK
jgi:hypothetical protein